MNRIAVCNLATLKPATRLLISAMASVGLFAAIASPAFAQGQPAPQLAPLQPKVPMQPNLPIGPKEFNPTGPAPDLVFVTQTMIDQVQRRPIIVKNIGTKPSLATTVSCGGGGELPPPEKVFAFVDPMHAVKALAPGETHEHLQTQSIRALSSYECKIAAASGERATSNNTFKWSAAPSNSAASWTGSATREPLQKVVIARPDLALESIRQIETHPTALGDHKLSFVVNVKNVGNVDVAGASIDCVPLVTIDTTGRKLNVGGATNRVSPYTHVSGAGESHVVPFDFQVDKSHMSIWDKSQPGQIACKLTFDGSAGDTVAANNQSTALWGHPDRRALNFPIFPR